MTEGSILRNLLIFAAPVLIGNIFQQLYNVADTSIIGNILGDNALAAVGASSPVYGLLISFSNGVANGFAVIIARYFGAQNDRELKKSIALTYMLSAVMAVLLTVIFILTEPDADRDRKAQFLFLGGRFRDISARRFAES